MTSATIVLFLFLFDNCHALFWDLLNCPQCYLPSLNWDYPPPMVEYSPVLPVDTVPIIEQPQAVQIVPQRVQYVYTKPRQLQQIKYVYQQHRRPVVSFNQATQYPSPSQGYTSQSNQPPRPVYRLTSKELERHGYKSGSSYASGSSRVYGEDYIANAPYASPKSTEDNGLVEWEDVDEDKKKLKNHEEDNNFHIHEDVELRKNKPNVLKKSKAINVIHDKGEGEDLDILTTDTHSKPETNLGESGKPSLAIQEEKIGIEEQKGKTLPENVEIIDKPKAQEDEFHPIGKDLKSMVFGEPAKPPPTLVKTTESH